MGFWIYWTENLNTMLSFSADQVSLLSPLPPPASDIPFLTPATTYQHQMIAALSVIPPIDSFSFISLIAVFPSVMFRSGLSLNGTGRIHGHQRDGRCGTNRGTESPRSPSEESALVPRPRRPPVDLLFHAERALLSLQFRLKSDQEPRSHSV